MDSNELTIVVDGVEDLNDASRDHLVRKLRRTVRNHVNDTGSNAQIDLTATVLKRPHYASVKRECPHCGSPLKLREPDLDPQNGATATATCPECTFSGIAQYRMIDLLVPQATGSMEGAVPSGEQNPEYHQYGEALAEDPQGSAATDD
jgi:excinuclease UvrABC ATPase subunit